jgi:hypothetical protein
MSSKPGAVKLGAKGGKKAPHIKAIEDAKGGLGGAKPESDSGAATTGTGPEDYEAAKAVKANKAAIRQEDIDMVKELDAWG